MSSISAAIPENLQEAMDKELEKGVYGSKSEMIREGIRLLLKTRIEPNILSDSTVKTINERAGDISEEDLIPGEEVHKNVL